MLEGILQPWVYVPVLFIAWLGVAFALKKLAFHRLRLLAMRTAFRFDDVLVESLSRPISILILGAGLLLLSRLLPLTGDADRAVAVLLQLSIVAAGVLFFDRLLRSVMDLYREQIQAGISPKTVSVIVRTLIYGTALLIFLDSVGVSITPLIASLGIGSLAVGLALQDTLINLFSGIYVSFDKPVRVGDFVKLESGEEGYVTDIGWRSTRIRMLANNMVIIPNHKLTSSILTNYYAPDKEVAVLVQVGVHYDSDLEKVERVTTDVARRIMKSVPGGVPAFEPFIRYHTFDASSINFTVVMRAREFVDSYLIKHEFIKALQKRFREEGIVIPFPLRTIDLAPEAVQALRQAATGRTEP